MLDLFKARVLSTDDRLELQWLKDGPVLKGKVKADGTVMVKTPDGWQSYASLSTAASRVAGRSLDGWKHWRRVNALVSFELVMEMDDLTELVVKRSWSAGVNSYDR